MMYIGDDSNELTALSELLISRIDVELMFVNYLYKIHDSPQSPPRSL